jgi:hypothetical protein
MAEDSSWRERISKYVIFRKTDLPTLRVVAWLSFVPPVCIGVWIWLHMDLAYEERRSKIAVLCVVALAWYVLLAGAAFMRILFRRLEYRHLALRRFVFELRDYAVSNIEPLRGSLNVLKEAETGEPPPAVSDFPADERELSTRERNTLLALIGVLCEEAKIDYRKPSAAANAILSRCAASGVKLGETTIEEKLKLVPAAMEARRT